MAQLLYDRDSTQKHLNATRRHLRLCKQVKNTQGLIKQIQPLYESLQQKEADTQSKKDIREDRYDDLLMADNLLDDSVRMVFRRCEEYDRQHPGVAVLQQIFPEGKFGHIVNTNMQQPDVVEKLAMRLENLTEKHALYPLAQTLRQQVDASRKAIAIYQGSIKQVKLAEAEKEIAQAALRRQYETNYLDARKLFGKLLSERLFPKLKNTTSKAEMAASAEDTTSEEAA